MRASADMTDRRTDGVGTLMRAVADLALDLQNYANAPDALSPKRARDLFNQGMRVTHLATELQDAPNLDRDWKNVALDNAWTMLAAADLALRQGAPHSGFSEQLRAELPDVPF